MAHLVSYLLCSPAVGRVSQHRLDAGERSDGAVPARHPVRMTLRRIDMLDG
jgi:hypothetical protein